MNETFTSILDRPVASTEKPRPMPVGHYLCVVKGQPKQDVSSKKKTPYVEFTLQPLQAAEDVNPEDLAATLTSKATGEVKPLSAKEFRATYYLTEDALWRLKDFLEHCGIEAGEGSYSQAIAGTPGCQVLVNIRHRPSEDGTSIFAEVGGTAAVAA